MRRSALLLMAAACSCAIMQGCDTPQPIAPPPVAAPNYAQAWDAALDVLASNRYRVVVADREQGFIETAPTREGSWLDPWYIGPHESAGEVTQALTAMQRRIVRVRFVAAQGDGADGSTLPGWNLETPLLGVAPAGSADAPAALSAEPSQPVLAYWTTTIERRSQPNQNPNAWSGSLETAWRADTVVQEAAAPDMAPVVRDVDPWVPIRTDNEESNRLARALLVRVAPSAAVAGPSTPRGR